MLVKEIVKFLANQKVNPGDMRSVCLNAPSVLHQVWSSSFLC